MGAVSEVKGGDKAVGAWISEGDASTAVYVDKMGAVVVFNDKEVATIKYGGSKMALRISEEAVEFQYRKENGEFVFHKVSPEELFDYLYGLLDDIKCDTIGI